MTRSQTILKYTAFNVDRTYEYTNRNRQHYWFMYNIQQDNLILNLRREALSKNLLTL